MAMALEAFDPWVKRRIDGRYDLFFVTSLGTIILTLQEADTKMMVCALLEKIDLFKEPDAT